MCVCARGRESVDLSQRVNCKMTLKPQIVTATMIEVDVKLSIGMLEMAFVTNGTRCV